MENVASCVVSSIIIVAVGLFLQGILYMLHYRKNFGHAPIPHSPSHGVVVAYSNHTIAPTSDGDKKLDHEQNQGTIATIKDEMMMNYTFQAYNPPSKSSRHSSSPSSLSSISSEPPLRLLVIGDSLARGVGQAHNYYPVLPQSIAKSLSRELNSRIIYWTNFSEPGASTKWLSELVEEEVKRKKKQLIETRENQGDFEKSLITRKSHSLKEFNNMHSYSSSAVNTIMSKEDWVMNLQYHKKLHEQNPFGDYDIIIVVAGPNDIKRMLVPFLIEDEKVTKEETDEGSCDQQQQVDQRDKERGFAADMQNLIHFLNMNNPQHHITTGTKRNFFKTKKTTSYSQNDERLSEKSCLIENDDEDIKERRESPLIVFPRIPVDISPVKIGKILRIIGVYLNELMNCIKIRISNKYSNVISPEPSGRRAADEYLRKLPKNEEPGLLNKKSEVMVNIIDVKLTECLTRKNQMTEFYSKRDPKDFCIESPVQKLLAPDGIHLK